MRTTEITIVSANEDDLGEVQGVFRGANLIGAWSMNDAHWRGEYMNGFMHALGFKVKTRDANPSEIKKLKTALGFVE